MQGVDPVAAITQSLDVKLKDLAGRDARLNAAALGVLREKFLVFRIETDREGNAIIALGHREPPEDSNSILKYRYRICNSSVTKQINSEKTGKQIMGRWAESSISGKPEDAVFRVSLTPDYRVGVPKPLVQAVSWLEATSARQDVICEFAEAGQLIVHPAAPLKQKLLAAAEAEEELGDAVRLVFTSGSFVLNSLRLSDLIAPHLSVAADSEPGAPIFILVRSNRIELWSEEYWRVQVKAARQAVSGLTADPWEG